MAIVIVPWPNREVSSFTVNVSLDGRRYFLHAKWNTVHDYWAVDVSDENETLLVAGLKLVIGVELLNRYHDARLPPGQLVAVDVSGTIGRIGRNDMGNQVQLAYATV